MKYIYIDGGARQGEAIDVLLTNRTELNGCLCYMFECNPSHLDSLKNLKTKYPQYDFIIKNEAVWIDNLVKKFYLSIDKWGDLGCTLKKEKKELLDLDNPIEVQCCNIVEFLSNFNEEHYIILKLDIEGAEYEVLRKIIDSDTIHKIKELHVEFHDHFFDENSYDIKQAIQNICKNIKCNFNWQ